MESSNCSQKLAVLLTCYNRRAITLECLDSLFCQELSVNMSLEVYLVDDGSTDGTGNAVKQKFPDVNVIAGSGNLYWGGGMRLAWETAMERDFDFYLWLNDDTLLLPDALTTIFAAVNSLNEGRGSFPGIIVGSTFNAITGAHTYGGSIQIKAYALDFRPVVPSGSLEPCDTFNGNCVLVSREAFHELGNLSQEFTHAMGDIDYGLRAKKKRIPIWVAPKYVGRCSNNPTPVWLDNALTLRKRIRNLNGPKGLPPREWSLFCRRHTGWRWPCKVVKVYLRVLAPATWDRLRGILR